LNFKIVFLLRFA